MPYDFSQLPVLGLGVSLSLAAEPDPLWLAKQKNGPQFVEYAGEVDVARSIDDIERVKAAGLPVLFHPSFINFCGSFANSPTWLKAAADHINEVQSPWFAQDCAYCFRDEAFGYSSQFGYFVPPIFNQHSLEKAIARVKEVQAVMNVPIAIEPPPLTFVVGNMKLLDFFGQLANACDCAILLDMGHLVSYEMASGQSVLEGTTDFPWQRVVEVHVAGGKLKDGQQGAVYIDAHEADVLDETWHMLEKIVPKLSQLKAVCFECEGVDGEKVLHTLANLRKTLQTLSASANFLAKLEV